jgi:PPK2 family polyphosphate:nucleotide phosphotransferase
MIVPGVIVAMAWVFLHEASRPLADPFEPSRAWTGDAAGDLQYDRASTMKIESGRFAVRKGEKVRLDRRPTRVDPFYSSKDDFARVLSTHVDRLSHLQQLLYSSQQYALLVIFQGMDASGKDGAIRHVMSGVNPQGVEVSSFKQPSATELEHDFLWREAACLPARGRIGIFNRSYYEEVLVVRVHPETLRAEGLAADGSSLRRLWKERYHSMVEFERHLHGNGTRVVKFFLHLSKEEQRRRFLARIDEPHKNWKFSMSDVHERRYWSRYQLAFEECLSATSRRRAPWYVVPADDKLNARLIVSQVLIDTLTALGLRYPSVSAARRRELLAIRRHLA